MNPATIWVLDTETTGLDPASDAVVEIAVLSVNGMIAPLTDGPVRWFCDEPIVSFVNPHRQISYEAMGVHHIVEADVAGAPDLGEAIEKVLTPTWRDHVDIVAAHNARFDRDMLPLLKDRRWIDTYRCAIHVWPDAPNFKNATLFYWLGGQRPDAGQAHSAAFDVKLTAFILCRLLAERSVEELLTLSTKAVVLRKIGFGKHFGKLWAEAPTDYLEWASKQDFDSDVKFTVKTELRRRQND